MSSEGFLPYETFAFCMEAIKRKKNQSNKNLRTKTTAEVKIKEASAEDEQRSDESRELSGARTQASDFNFLSLNSFLFKMGVRHSPHRIVTRIRKYTQHSAGHIPTKPVIRATLRYTETG